jgi:hypothetical protein
LLFEYWLVLVLLDIGMPESNNHLVKPVDVEATTGECGQTWQQVQ